MRRHVQLFHLAQARRGPLRRRLKAKPPGEWPEHLKLAWTILHDELLLPEAAASQLILDSVSAVQDCAEHHQSAVTSYRRSEFARQGAPRF